MTISTRRPTTTGRCSSARGRWPCRSCAPIPISWSTSAAGSIICAGAIADLYERMDGEVFWAGKPHANAYEAARAAAEKLRGAPVPKERILAIGDSLRTDLKGAEAAGIDAIFIASGIHRDETMGVGRAVGRKADDAVCAAGTSATGRPESSSGRTLRCTDPARGLGFLAEWIWGDHHEPLRSFRSCGRIFACSYGRRFRRRYRPRLLAQVAQGRRPAVHVGSLSSGSGEGRTKAAARSAAIRSWVDFTNFEYGSAWARFSAAASSTTRYTKADNGWSADIDARPCRG